LATTGDDSATGALWSWVNEPYDQQRTKLAAVKVTGGGVLLAAPHLPVPEVDDTAARARGADSTPASPQHVNGMTKEIAMARPRRRCLVADVAGRIPNTPNFDALLDFIFHLF
jgi:hypothetical protein